MTEEIERMPFNKVGTKPKESVADVAQSEGISEEEWRAQNLPSEPIEFRWRYNNKNILLYERRLRSLGAFNVGPAVQAWVRSRLEWVRDNKFYDMPDGVIVLSIDPEGVVDIKQEELTGTPAFNEEMLISENIPGTLWFAVDGALYTAEAPKHAADTLVSGLAETLGWQVVIGVDAPEGATPFIVSDEFGILVPGGSGNEMTAKLIECFDKLWALNK